MPNADLMSCGAVAASLDGSKLFVGTGEGSRYAADCQLPFEGYSYEGVGVLVSLDKGKSWTLESSNPSLVGHAFFSLAMDPADNNKLVGATTNGIYLRIQDPSSPSGYSWQRQKMGPENNSVSSVAVSRMNNQTTFFAARWGDKVYHSNDGKNWQPHGSQFPTKKPDPGPSVGRIALAVQPNNPNTAYALIAGQEKGMGGLYGIYRCDKGANWKEVKNSANNDGPFTDMMGGRGWWQMSFTVDPSNINRFFAAGTEFFQLRNY